MSYNTQSVSQASDAFSIPSISKQRSRSSWIWEHMQGGPTAVVTDGLIDKWVCNYCMKRYIATGGTTTISVHLKKHGKTNTANIPSIETGQEHIMVAMGRAQENQNKRRKIYHGDDASFNPRLFEELLLDWIAVDSISFHSCESARFKRLLKYLNPHTTNAIPRRTTLQTWTMQQYITRKRALKKELAKVTQKVHLSIDLWTGQGKAYIGVIAHYFELGQRKAPVLIFREFKGRHTGANQAVYMMDALVEFDLTHKLGYVMLDNASNNDSLMQSIEESMMH